MGAGSYETKVSSIAALVLPVDVATLFRSTNSNRAVNHSNRTAY